MEKNKNIYYSEKVTKYRKLRYGGMAVGLTAAVTALVIALNAIFGVFASKYGWFADMTGEELYSISQKTRDLVDGCRRDRQITFYFCNTADRLDSAKSTHLIHNLLKQYADEYGDFIKIEYLDVINHPDSVPAGVSDVSRTDVIVSDGVQTKKLSEESFYITDPDDGSVWAFNGEYRVNVTLLQYEESSIAYFTTGHGEKNEKSEMWTLFEDAGYDVRVIDLEKETPEDSATVMVINSPAKDFMGASDPVNEIRKVDEFLDSHGGLMVFADADTPDMPELNELLSEWGIKFEKKLIRDYDNSMTGTEGRTVFADYAKSGEGSSLTKALTSLSSLPRTVAENARPVTVMWNENSFGNSNRTVSPVLLTYETAHAEAADGSGEQENGPFNLMTVSVDQRYINNEPNYSYVLAAGTSSFADEKYLKNTYGNRDLIFYIMRTFGRKAAPFDSYEWMKPFDETDLSVTAGKANFITLVLTGIVPVIIFGTGYCIYRKRKHL